MGLLSAKQAAKLWGISQRRVSVLCSENKVVGAFKVANVWLIPTGTPKPIDGRKLRYPKEQKMNLKPFAKWAGGKGQILADIQRTYPAELGKSITKYAEPFVGGGAVLFDVLANYNLQEIYISDINAELINTYNMIKNDCESLIARLKVLKLEYMEAQDQREYYNEKRAIFNDLKLNGNTETNFEKAALFIFLNKTCFNGLYRVNRKGGFNVPMGAYKNPNICDEENLRNISKALQNVTIVCGDYKQAEDFIDQNTFVYFDPPYRPLTETSAFNSYTEDGFNDDKQAELAAFARKLSEKGAKIVLSNSDPKNVDEQDNFFDELYNTFHISRISATRMINSRASSRGPINELLIQTDINTI